jgi:hypothetical protein
MPANFAAIEARVNNAVFAHLANTQAQINGGAPVAVIFDNGFASAEVGLVGMSSSRPMLTLPTAGLSADPVGQTAVVNGTSYLVAAHQPDGTGVSTLMLERA